MIGSPVWRTGVKRLLVWGILSLAGSAGVQAEPLISSFKINNGAATTANPAVTLPNVCTNTTTATVTYYQASESDDFTSATWQSYASVPLFILSSGNGIKTVYFRVKDIENAESAVTSDTISLGGSGFPLLAWGSNNNGECAIPLPNAGFVDVAGGISHSLGLKGDGSVVAWGFNASGECTVPSPNSGFVAVTAGYYQSMGLKADGSLVAWGNNSFGQCNVPVPNSDFVACAGGHGFNLGLKADGSIVGWGDNGSGQLDLPSPNSGFVAVSAGDLHCLGLKADGSIVAWGNNTLGQCSVPSPNSEFVAIAAGGNHSLGLKANGSIIAWGDNGKGQCSIPAPNSGFRALSAGNSHSQGLKTDGSIVAWGNNTLDQCAVPALNIGWGNTAAGGYHSLALIAEPALWTPVITSFKINNGLATTANPVVTLSNVCPGAASSTHLYMASESSDFTSVTWQSYASVPLFTLSGGDGIKTVYFKVKDSANAESAVTSDTIRLTETESSIVSWGFKDDGVKWKSNEVPAPNRDWVAISAGDLCNLGLKSDGSIVTWKNYSNIQVPHPSPNSDFVAAAVGGTHYLCLKSDGSIVGQGQNDMGQRSVPSPNRDFVAVAAGYAHSLGLKSNGSIVAWGDRSYNRCSVPSPNRDFVDLSAGNAFSLGLKSNGSIVAWGANDYGQCNIPEPNTDFISLAAGESHGLALKSDGSIVAWGINGYGQCNVPAPNRDFVAVAARGGYSLGMKSNGSTVLWGANNWYHQDNMPSPNSGFLTIATGTDGALALAPASHTLETSAKHGYISREPDLAVYPRGTTVTLTAHPDAGFWFERWTGDVPTGFEWVNPLVLPMAQDRRIEADFEPGPLPPAPVITSFKINNGAPATLNPTVTLTNICTAETSGTAVEYQASESPDFTGATWQRYGIVPMFTLTEGKGEKTVYFKVRNNTKGESSVTSDTILLGDAGLPVVAWGDNSEGQGVVPPHNRGFVSLAGGYSYNLGLKSDGSIVQWGKNNNGLYYPPSPNQEFIAVSAGSSHCLGLKSDGSIVPWGSSTAEVPSPSNDFVAISVGVYDNSVGLKSDGSVVTWDTDVPSPNSGFVAIAAGGSHRLGLKFDGSIVAWKSNISGQCNIPSPNRDFVAISAGMAHSLGLKSDGSIVAWGNNTAGQCTVPEPNQDFVAIAAGGRHSLGLKSDGSLVAWGDNSYGQCTIPEPNREYLAITAGQYHSLALTRNYLQVTLTPPRAVAAGARWRLASEAESVWHESGDTARKIGLQTLTFNTLYGWVTPVTQEVKLTSSGVTLATGTYTGVNWTLTTSSSNGSILQTPAGNSFPHLTTVTLTAQPDPGFWFDHWTGLVPSGLERVNPLVLTMDANKTIGTSFISGPLPPAPVISAFSINNGASMTANPTILLSNTSDSQTSASAVQYLASESPSFTNATWQPYRYLSMFRLSQGNGIKTVYFKVKNSADVESLVTSNTITLGGEGFSATVWGTNNNGQLDVPSPNKAFLAVAAGGGHNLGLKTDGSIEAWGWNNHGQTLLPSPNSDYVAAAAGVCHSLGLKSDGSIAAWGWNQDGQCLVPSPNSNFVAIAAGERHSLGLKSDGTIVAWGRNSEGQCSVPSPNKGFVAIAAGKNFSLGLKENGSIVVWGGPDANLQAVPVPNGNFIAISAGRAHCLGLKKDGSIMAWGSNLNETGNYVGQSIYPSPNSGFVALSAGWDFSLGLKSDGSIVAWGDSTYGQISLPLNKSGFKFISGGVFHSIALSPLSHLPMWMISLVDRQTAQEPTPPQVK